MIKLEINHDRTEAVFSGLDAALTDLYPVMAEIGDYLVASNQRGMDAGESPDGSLFAPRSPVTVQRYRKEGISSKLPLQVTGALRNSIAPQPHATGLSWGSNLLQAAVMQFGAAQGEFGAFVGKDKRGRDHFHHLPWGNIPARPFIGISVEDEANIIASLEDWLRRAVEQA